jgi:CubicO group peptidase (beta-lactamase class C family)
VITGAVPRIAGGVVSTANDYLKLLKMLANMGMYDGKRILSAKSVEIMLADQTAGATIGYSPFTKYSKVTGSRKDARYGIGNWVVNDIDAIDINLCPGAFGFTPWIDTRNNYYGVIAVQSAFPKVMPVFWNALHIINAEMNKKQTRRRTTAPPGYLITLLM